MQRLTLFLDDGGVMNDNTLRTPQWQRLLGEFFPPRLGGSAEAWAEANRVYTDGLWNDGGSWAEYGTRLWQEGGESYAGFHRAYQIEWLHGMCKVLGLPISRLWTFRQAPTTLNLLEGADLDSLEVVRLNDCAHHTPFFGEAKHRAL